MCKLASFVWQPRSMAVRVHDLTGHSETLEALGLKDEPGPLGWREGHYLPDGTLECRALEGDAVTGADAEAALRERWSTFLAFLSWALAEIGPDYPGYLDLTGCTGLTALPEGLSVGGSLYLTGCTGLTVPASAKISRNVYR